MLSDVGSKVIRAFEILNTLDLRVDLAAVLYLVAVASKSTETDSHMTGSSAIESLSVYIGPERIEIRAPSGLIRSACGSGESDQSGNRRTG